MFDSAPLVVQASTCLYYFCYYYINGLMFCLVVERLLATVMMRTYEHNRRWWPVALSQPFAIGLAVGNFFLPNLFSRSLTMLSLYALNILCLIALLLINYRITTALTGSGASLSTRYQITENIRTIRVLLPTVLFDALVSVVDVCGSIIFEVHHIFEISRCSDDNYIKFFYGFTTLSAIFEFLVPLSLLLSHPAYRRHSLLLYERQPLRIHSSIVKDKTLPKVVNVLGIEIANASEQAYFENLSRDARAPLPQKCTLCIALSPLLGAGSKPYSATPKAAAILLEEYSGFGRRCRRQRRPTVAAVVDNSDRPSPLSSTTATDRRRCRRQQRPTVAAVVDNSDRPSPLSSTTATDRRRCRRQQRPTVAAVVDNSDRPSPLSSTTATDRRRCRRQQRPTVAAVVDNSDRPSPLSSTTATDRRRCRRQQRPTVAAVVDNSDRPSPLSSTTATDRRRCRRQQRPTVAAVVDNSDRPSPLSSTTATDRRRCRRQQRPTVAAVVDNSDRPSPLSSTTATDRRRCRRQQRPTVAAVVDNSDRPSPLSSTTATDRLTKALSAESLLNRINTDEEALIDC
ncbi:hypothetical protein Y032_0508g2711 [Ancylostoma ceylanicum]|nr:hypothetical protein Y032_0508g2711 [Ancylostoma ceylanicum]